MAGWTPGLAKKDEPKPNGSNGTNGTGDNKSAAEKRKDYEEKKAAETKHTPAPHASSAQNHATKLLNQGGFTAVLTRRQRRQLYQLEKRTDALRKEITAAFPVGSNDFVRQTLDSLACIEVSARLEMLRPAKKN